MEAGVPGAWWPPLPPVPSPDEWMYELRELNEGTQGVFSPQAVLLPDSAPPPNPGLVVVVMMREGTGVIWVAAVVWWWWWES